MNFEDILNYNKYKNKVEWLSEDSLNCPQIKSFDIIIGFDTEFFLNTTNNKINNILSYQLSCYLNDNIHFSKGRYLEKIIYGGKNFQRKSLPNLLSEVLSDFDISQYFLTKKTNEKKREYFKILIVSHFSKAEWAMLLRRSSLSKYLVEIQGTLTSFKPFVININYKNRNEKIQILWQDTFLFSDIKGRSLFKLSESCINKKLEIPLPWTKERMDILLKENKELFQEYALQDARIALEYYCKYMQTYYNISKVKEIPFTVGDGSIRWYLKSLETKSLQEERFDKSGKIDKNWWMKKILGVEFTKGRYRQSVVNRGIDERFASDTFFGGLNTSFRLGHFKKENYFIFDLDFSNAYATSLAVIPVIDWKIISEKTFPLKDRLLLEAFKQKNHIDIGSFLIDGFSFPDNIFQTSLPIPDDAGLIYCSESDREVFCSYSEMVTAIKQNIHTNFKRLDCRIFHKLTDEKGEVVLAFAEFIKTLIWERKKYPKGSMENLLFKLHINAFYGKLARGIFDRYVYNLLGEKKKINESKITVPHYASSCTALVRSGLIDTINYFQSLDKVEVLSATTDDCMVAIHKSLWKENIVFETNEKGIVNTDKISVLDIIPNLYKDLSMYYSIRNILQGRKNLGLDSNWLEIKYIGDEAFTWKTRLNSIVYNGIEQHTAKGGIDKIYVSSLQDLLSLDNGQYISEIDNNSLVSTKEMIKYECDLVPKKNLKEHYKEKRKVNLDYDYKRFVFEDNSTRTFKNIEEWEYHRNIVKNIRRTGKRSTYEMVELSKKNKEGDRVRIQGSLQQTISRIFLSVLIRFNYTSLSYSSLVDILEKWRKEYFLNTNWQFNINLLKDIKRSNKQYQKSLPKLPKITKQIISMCEVLNIDKNKQKEIMSLLLKD